MNNEIKVGDKVKVSEDAPKVYLSSVNNLFKYHVCKVEETDGDSAKIRYLDIGIDRWLAIPTKYLVKVDAEAKEAKFKKGDKVRYIGDIQEHKGEMFVIDGDIFFNDYCKQWQASSIKTTPTEVWSICNVPLSDLEPDTEPTNQAEAEKKPNIGSITTPVEVELSDSYWQVYAADLAKEIAVKVANKFNDPKQAAEYAVQTAEAVVAGLKRK